MHHQDQECGGQAPCSADPQLTGKGKAHEADQPIQQGGREQEWRIQPTQTGAPPGQPPESEPADHEGQRRCGPTGGEAGGGVGGFRGHGGHDSVSGDSG